MARKTTIDSLGDHLWQPWLKGPTIHMTIIRFAIDSQTKEPILGRLSVA